MVVVVVGGASKRYLFLLKRRRGIPFCESARCERCVVTLADELSALGIIKVFVEDCEDLELRVGRSPASFLTRAFGSWNVESGGDRVYEALERSRELEYSQRVYVRLSRTLSRSSPKSETVETYRSCFVDSREI